jgi:hypothetical protein
VDDLDALRAVVKCLQAVPSSRLKEGKMLKLGFSQINCLRLVFLYITNGAVYTTIISTNVNRGKLIVMYRHPFIVQICSVTCFDL